MYLQKITVVYCEPFMQACHASIPKHYYHYRNSIHTIPAVRTTLTYVTSATYSRGYRIGRGYEQRSPDPVPNHILPIWSTYCWYIGSISSKPLLKKQRSVRITDGKANLSHLAEDPYLLTSTSNTSLLNIRLIVLESKLLQKCSAGSYSSTIYISSHLITPI
jgi:hypothetical protein